MSKEARTSATLGRGQKGEVAQVGSYRTDLYQNITSASTVFGYNTIMRIQSYLGDNWITRSNTLSQPATIDANITGATVTFEGSGEDYLNGLELTWISDKRWLNQNAQPWELIWEDNVWKITNLGTDIEYVDITTPETSFPTNFIAQEGFSLTPPAPTSATMTLPAVAAVDGQGMLLPEGSEITMLAYAGDVITTTGGSLNIVPVSE